MLVPYSTVVMLPWMCIYHLEGHIKLLGSSDSRRDSESDWWWFSPSMYQNVVESALEKEAVWGSSDKGMDGTLFGCSKCEKHWSFFLSTFHRCMQNWWMGTPVHIRKVGCAWVCFGVCVCVCVCTRMFFKTFNFFFFFSFFFAVHVKALLQALVYMILWFNHNVVDMVNVVTFYLVIISDTTN